MVKTHANPVMTALAMAMLAVTCAANPATWYVSTNGNDTAAGTSWETAKQTIQAAIDSAPVGSEIIVTNGVYAPITTTNQAITIRSVEGAAVTIIDGGETNRCATLGGSNDSAPIGSEVVVTNGSFVSRTTNNLVITNLHITIRSVKGVTVTFINGGDTNGVASLGGSNDGNGVKWVSPTNTILTGFTLKNGHATNTNVKVMRDYGGGSFGGTLNDCILTSHVAGFGGGSYLSTLNGCTLVGNTANQFGGGSYLGALTTCTLTGNTAKQSGGGSYLSTLNGCTLEGNTTNQFGGGSYLGALTNCILTGNIPACTLSNSIIVWENFKAPDATDNYAINKNGPPIPFRYSCTVPLPEKITDADGNTVDDGNIAADPLFQNAVNGDFRLRPGSPCIGAGHDGVDMGMMIIQEPIKK